MHSFDSIKNILENKPNIKTYRYERKGIGEETGFVKMKF